MMLFEMPLKLVREAKQEAESGSGFEQVLAILRRLSLDDFGRFMADHEDNGFAYLPDSGLDGETYGDTSLHPEYLEQAGWKVMAYDNSLGDPFQVSVVIKAV